VNRGAHALYKAGPAGAVLKRLGIKVRGSAPPLSGSAVLSEGDVHLLPTSLRIPKSPWLGKKDAAQLGRWMATWAVRRKPNARLAQVSAAQWLASRELRPRAQLVAEALVRVTSYCSDLTSVSADAIAHQLAIGLYPGVLYLDGGWNQLIGALCDQIPPIRQAKVESVVDSPGGYVVQTDTGTFRGLSVIVALESETGARRLLDKLAPTERHAAGPIAGHADTVPAATVACLDLVVAQPPTPRFILGLDEPVYLSLHSPPADLTAPATSGPATSGPATSGPAQSQGSHVVHLMRYGARAASVDRPLLEGVARLAGLEPDTAAASRFLADMTVISAPPSPAGGGLAGRPTVTALDLPGCFVAGDWVGPEGMLADTSFASGESAGLAAASHALGRGRTNAAGRRHGADSSTAA